MYQVLTGWANTVRVRTISDFYGILSDKNSLLKKVVSFAQVPEWSEIAFTCSVHTLVFSFGAETEPN